MKVSLARSLKLKNRLAGRINRVKGTIASYNSLQEGREDRVDVIGLEKERTELASALVEIKTAIAVANVGIYGYLAELEEKKGEIEWLNSLSTLHGKETNSYQGNVIHYVAIIKKNEVDQRVKNLEREIDELQDKVDTYNAMPERVSLSSRLLELAS